MIYFDNAGTTKVNMEVLKAYSNASLDYYNPSAAYKPAIDVNNKINSARAEINKLLGGKSSDSLYFTSGATEANNLAIMGTLQKRGKILFSKGEHPSVYNVAIYLKNSGYSVDFINLNKNGTVDIEDYKQKLTKDVYFISIMHVSNETGAINDLKQLVDIAKKVNNKIIFHSDGVQAFGKINFNVNNLGVDLYSISSHKINGVKGIGSLWVKNGINIKPIILGGGQERGIRSGTENVPGIISFAKAANLAVQNLTDNYNYVEYLKNYLVEGLKNCKIKILFTIAQGSPYITSFSVNGIKGETVVHILEQKEILINTGSACSSKNKGNRVLEAIGCNKKHIEGSVRISFNHENTKQEIDELINHFNTTFLNYIKTGDK